MPREHDFVQAFHNLTVALKQGDGIIRLDDSVTAPFQHTAIPSDTTGLKAFAEVILRKGLFVRLDATAVYTVVFAALQYPPCPILSKIAYHMLENLLICKNVKKLSSKSQDQSTEWLKEIKKRSKIISTVLMKRLRETLIDTKRDIKIRRLVAEIIAGLCVGDRRACSILASDATDSLIGSLFRYSTDPVLRLHVGDIARHLRANDIEMTHIWGDRTDEDAMDFPSSAELRSPEAEKVLMSMERMQGETGPSVSESNMYRLSEIRVQDRHIHSSSNDSAIVLDENITILVPGKEQVFGHYETPIDEHVELESTDEDTTGLRMIWTNQKGFWSCRGKKQAVGHVDLRFGDGKLRDAFMESFKSIKARFIQKGVGDSETAHQETQKLSMPILRFSEDADNTDVEETLISSPDEPRTREALPTEKGTRIVEARPPISETIVNQHQPTSAVFKTRSKVVESIETESTTSKLNSGTTSHFLKKVTTVHTKQKTPRLTKNDELFANQIPVTSPSKHIDGSKIRTRKSMETGSTSVSPVNRDPVLTVSLEQQEDADYQAFHGQRASRAAGPSAIQAEGNGQDEQFEGDPEMLFDIQTSQREEESVMPVSTTRTQSKKMSQVSPLKGPRARLNPVNTGITGSPYAQRRIGSQKPAEGELLGSKARKNADVDYDEHLKATDADEASEQPESALKPRKSKVNIKQPNHKPQSNKAKGEEVTNSAVRKKGGQARSKFTSNNKAAPSSPKVTRRSKRTAGKTQQICVEPESSEEGEDTAMQANESAYEGEVQSKPKVKTRKAPPAPVPQMKRDQKRRAGEDKQTAIEVASTDDEGSLNTGNHLNIADRPSPQAKSLRKSSILKGAIDHNMTEGQDVDVVQDSYPQEGFSENPVGADNDAIYASESVEKSTKIQSARPTDYIQSNDSNLKKAIPTANISDGQAELRIKVPSAMKSTTTKSSRARRSRDDNRSARGSEHPKRPSIVHFGSAGPANQGSVPAEVSVQVAQSHTSPQKRNIEAHAGISTLTRPDSNAPSNARIKSKDKADNMEAEVVSVYETTNMPQHTDQDNFEDLAQNGLLTDERLTKSRDFTVGTLQEQYEAELADEEAADEQSNATSSEAKTYEDQLQQSTSPTSRSAIQVQPLSHETNFDHSQDQHSDSFDSEEPATNTSSSETDGEESEFEASLQVDEDSSVHIARPIRLTHPATDSSDLVAEAVPELVDTRENIRQQIRNPAQPPLVETMAKVGIQPLSDLDEIAKMARERNPGAQGNIHFKSSKPLANTLANFTKANLGTGPSTINKTYDYGVVTTAIPKAGAITSFEGSPRRASMPKGSRMLPPSKPFAKTDSQKHQNLVSTHQQNHLAHPRGEEDNSIGRSPDIRRVRPSFVRHVTPIIEQHHQNTPLPYALQLLATTSPVSNSTNSEINRRSETGDTTLVDPSLFIRDEEPRSPSLMSSQLSEVSVSPRTDLGAQTRIGASHQPQQFSDVGEGFRRHIESSIMAITQQIFIRLDTEEHLSKTLVETHRRGCTRIVEELKKNAMVRVQHDAGKLVTIVKDTKAKLQEAIEMVDELHRKHVKMNNLALQGEQRSVNVCKSMLEKMLKRGNESA